MIGKGKKERAALDRLADLLVDDILSMSDEDILAEYRETHGDPVHNAALMQSVFEKVCSYRTRGASLLPRQELLRTVARRSYLWLRRSI